MESERDEASVIEAQLGRRMRAPSKIAARCHLSLPVVLTVPPVLDSGEPFPTRYWLTCPLAHRRIARLEAAGAVRDYDARAEMDVDFAEALRQSHASYAQERDALIPNDAKLRPRGGVAGAVGGVKCLHAHFAHHAGGGTNPIGAEVAKTIGPLNCAHACVKDGSRSPDWREPSQTTD